MKKKPAITKPPADAKAKPGDLTVLITEVRDLIQSARRGVASVVDTFQAMTNFEIGRRIVEHEQKGAKRAAYGTELLKELSRRLTEEFGRGFSKANLEYMRRFYKEWQNRGPQIAQTVSGQLIPLPIPRTPSGQSKGKPIFQSLSEKLEPEKIGQSASDQLTISETLSRKSGQFPFTLSWSHYVELLGIKDPDERNFYEIESRQSTLERPRTETAKSIQSLRTTGPQSRQGRNQTARQRGTTHHEMLAATHSGMATEEFENPSPIGSPPPNIPRPAGHSPRWSIRRCSNGPPAARARASA